MDLLWAVVPLALVVGLSPLPILPAVLLLMTERGRANSFAFLSAWLVALSAVLAVGVALGSRSSADTPTDEGIGWVQVVTGLAFLAMAAVKWARRPRAGAVKEPPGWIARLDSFRPAQAARLGAILAAGNPKNIVMALAAGAELAVLAESAAQLLWGAVLFVLVGSVGVGTPILASAASGERAQPVLLRGKGWLERNSTTLAVGVLLVLGGMLILKGLPSAT